MVVAASRIREDPVGFWLGRLRENTRRTVIYDLQRFLRWVNTKPGYHGVDARGLLLRQLEADDAYEILTLLQEFLSLQKVRKSTNVRTYGSIHSYFLHNRVRLPDDVFHVPGFKPPTLSRLTERDIAKIASAAKPRDRSLILTKWMGLLDTEGVMYVGEHLAGQIVSAIEKHELPIRLDLPGRKHMENEVEFFTYIGKDAIDALTFYFENERGWPKPDEPVWLNKFGKPMRARTWPEAWLDLIRRAGMIQKMPQHDHGSRYGYNTHEMRDAALSLLHTKAKKDGFDLDCAEFWLGHTVDPLKYDKFYKDKNYMPTQYRIAEPYLNIITAPSTSQETEEQKQTIAKLEERLAKLEAVHSERLTWKKE